MKHYFRIFHTLTAVVLTTFLTSCATMPEKLQKRMLEGKPAEAITLGEEYLAKKPFEPDSAKVRELVKDADYRIAVTKDTVAGYEYFERKYKDLPQDLPERKSKAFYREVTIPANTAAAAKEFQEKFPASSLVKEAGKLEHDLAWREAKARGTEAALATFATAYPDSAVVAEANDKICQMAWKESQAANTLEAYKTFISTYGRCKTELIPARQKEEQMAWNQALAAGSTELLEKYVSEHPDSARVPEALGKICELAWSRVESQTSLEAVQEFQKKYGRCTTQIKTARAKEEQLAWSNAQKTHTWEGYRDFIDAFPQSSYTGEADERRRNLFAFAGPLGDDELETSITSTDDRDPNNIRLYVQVTDKEGKVVGGLKRSNFSVFENGCPTDMSGFEGMEVDRPVDIVFILDTTGSMRKEIDGVKNATIQFAENLKMRNRATRIALITFGDEIRKIHDFTTDIRAFQGWVSRQKADGGGDSPENSLGAMEAALQKLTYRPLAQTVFVLITDTTAQENNEFTKLTVPQLGDMLRTQRVTLFSISPDIAQYKDLVGKTGGKLFNLEKYPEFSKLLEEIGTMTAKQYLVAYKGTSCRIEAPGRTARVRARQDYLWLPSSKIESRDVASIITDNDNPALSYMATRDAGLFRSADGGKNWQPIGRELGERSFEEISPLTTHEGGLLARTVGKRHYISHDGGNSWLSADRFNSGRMQTVYDTASKKLFATDGKALYSSNDRGRTWNDLVLPELVGGPVSLARDRDGKGVIAIGRGDIALRTRDGGITWKPVRLVLPEAGRSLGDYRLHLHPKIKNVMFMTRRGGNIFRSVDSGVTWVRVTPAVAGGYVFSDTGDLLFDTSKRGWVLYPSSRGVMASSDAGSSWFPIGEGIGVSEKGSSAVSVGSDGKILLAGSSGTLYNLNPIADREFISGNIYFDSGKAVIKPDLFGYLNNLADHLRKSTEKQVSIEGHTDDKGDDAMNMRLSLQRANSVKTYLMSLGIDGGRITTSGSGKQRPIVANDSDANRAKNRRVEIVILN